METFIEKQDDKFGIQLNTFCNKIDLYSGTLGLDPLKVTALKESKSFIGYIITGQLDVQTYAEGFTAYKNLARYGPGSGAIAPIPVFTLPPTPPTPTRVNIQEQFADMIQDCVRSTNFTATIAEDLGILKPESEFDPEAGQPIIKLKLAEGGHPLLHVKKGKYQGWMLWKDRSDSKGFVYVDKILHPDYLDLDPLPAPGVRQLVRYKGIYMFADKPAGTESAVVDIWLYGGAV